VSKNISFFVFYHLNVLLFLKVVTTMALIYEAMMFLEFSWFVVFFLCVVVIGVGGEVKPVDDKNK
jgi:hypothetical protein